MEGLRARTWLAVIGLAAAISFVVPNFVDTSNISWWPARKINFGLDIQGGLHLVMGADVGGVIATSIHRQTEALKVEFAKEGIPVKSYDTANGRNGEFVIHVASAADAQRVVAHIQKSYGTVLQVISSDADSVEIKYFDAYLSEQKQNVISQAIETIRNRIDEFGVAEPSITQQGADRILVQLPGMADAERAKQLINTTAKLDFMIVSYEKSPEELRVLIEQAEKAGNYSMETLKYSDYVTRLNQDLAGKLPAKTVVYFEKSENARSLEVGSIPYLLRTDTDLSGDVLDNAAVAFGQFGEPEVSLRFNPLGANKFADLTGNHINQQMAVVLDRVVKTAPKINAKIPNGQAVITLGSVGNREDQMNEAKLIATALRAGALPASLEQLEERRVGPSLGLDALEQAKMGSYVGAILVMIFMVVYYKGMGVISTIGMAINIFSMFALLGSLGATLTLPGIAGMALTVGFAVDANVLINERMKEELAKGASLQSAVREGYNKAMSAILDSNITVSATALILLYFGTGPVRGFAVTLLVGIVTTLFGNVFVSKVMVDNLVYRFGLKKLSV
ncbi:protein translocase subunit SecD [Pseudobdellovibrio exovorus]|uniref:Protein translocase subunit SecD n=1 Tax=Pseudobdellovibrio exovorus JSS TaxID=1184267 RepID=M4V8C2_9BACT|nr:protein translocase subunit SecD [Pseudobdellovibrio exovorus]AGH95637.1 SecD, protein-export membrane protein [Pseudobdellovibrio exovorus JSS]